MSGRGPLAGFEVTPEAVIAGAQPEAHGKRYAYAFYATNDTYAIAVLTCIHLLRLTGMREDADIVVLHLQLSTGVVEGMRRMGALTRRVARLPYVYGFGFEDCLVKLRVFQLTGYERVIYLDADAIPLRPLDGLFDFAFDGPVAAPSAYWLPQPYWTSLLLVVKPSAELWNRVSRHFQRAFEKGQFDMELVNAEFAGEIETLPDGMVALNSEWEDLRRPGYFRDPEDGYRKVSVVHFTALGKPWLYTVSEARRLRPHAHPIFHELWEKWWAARREAAPGITDGHGWRRRLRALWISHVRHPGLVRLSQEATRAMRGMGRLLFVVRRGRLAERGEAAQARGCRLSRS
jgi:hypothetical protein